MVEGAFGGVGEFSRIEGFVGGGVVGFGGMGCGFDRDEFSVGEMELPSIAATQSGVAAVRRFADR